MRVVLDTNVLLSAAFFPGICEKVLTRCLLSPGTMRLVLSEHILREFREHATGKLQGAPQAIRAFESELRRLAAIVEPAAVPLDAFDDPDDLPVLGTAVAGQAGYLVTGDRALLALATYQGTALLSPRAFYDQLT